MTAEPHQSQAQPCLGQTRISDLLTCDNAHHLGILSELVCELVTNAADASIVLPSHPPLTLRLLATAQALVIEVCDHSPGDLAPLTPSDTAECGRGLTVVAALSTRWGSERTSHHHKTVWAELPR